MIGGSNEHIPEGAGCWVISPEREELFRASARTNKTSQTDDIRIYHPFVGVSENPTESMSGKLDSIFIITIFSFVLQQVQTYMHLQIFNEKE